MVVFKEENGNLYYRINDEYKQLNNLNYLTTSSVNAGLMSTEDKVKLDSITQPTTPQLGQTYFCTDYPEGGSTIECMLVYNGNNWIKI